MKALVVGLGSIGRRHARNWATLELGPLAICRQIDSPQPEPLGVNATEYHDLDQALQQEHPDLVLVTNPTSLHVATACTALRSGAHVLVEKPLGHALDGLDELLRSAAQTGRHLAVGYNLRFHPGLQRLRQLVQQGAIGTVVSARAQAGEYLPHWHPAEDYRRSYSGRRDLGGGAVLTFSHELDALCWILGAPTWLVAVAAHASSLEIDTEDTAEILLQFPTGAIGSVHVDYVRRPPTRTIELTGEQGVLRWDFGANRLEHYSAATEQWRLEDGDPRFERNQMFLDELRQFVRLITKGEQGPLASGEEGAAIVALALAALRSSAEGRAIEVADDAATSKWLNQQNRPVHVPDTAERHGG